MVRLIAWFLVVVVCTVLATACGPRSIKVAATDPTLRNDSGTLVPLDPFPPLPQELQAYQGLGSAPVTKDLQHARDLAFTRAHRALVTTISTAYETRFAEGSDRAIVTNVVSSRGILVGRKLEQTARLGDTIYVRLSIPEAVVDEHILPALQDVATELLRNDVKNQIRQDLNSSRSRLQDQLRLLSDAQREWTQNARR